MRWTLAVLALLLSGLGFADPQTDAEIQRLESQLQRVQQEQQSLYQQFQMVQELRRTEVQAENPQVIQNSTDYSMANPPPNYDDLVREKTRREDRIKQYTEELNRVYARYSELEAQRKLLLDRLNELTLQR
jgi:predicted  nucleic acid-binding Zn-ribbon protein